MNKQYIYLGVVGAALATAFLNWQHSETEELSLMNASPSETIVDTRATPQETLLIDTLPQKANDPRSTLEIEQKFFMQTFATTAEYEASSRFGELPPHMKDVRIEELAFDREGQLILDEQIKNVFEFFLMAQETEGLDQAIARLKEYLSMTLPSSALDQALVIADQYLSYKQSLSGQQFSDSADLSDETTLSQIKLALDERKRIRREVFGSELSQAIFGYEEAYENYSYRRLKINATPFLSEEDKEARISEAENQLPHKLAEKLRYKRHEKQLQTQITDLISEGNQEEKIYQLRKEFYGEKVADRLAYLEETSPEWEHRLDAFHSQKKAILLDQSLNEVEKASQLRELTQQSFSYKEQVKLAVQQIRG